MLTSQSSPMSQVVSTPGLFLGFLVWKHLWCSWDEGQRFEHSRISQRCMEAALLGSAIDVCK